MIRIVGTSHVSEESQKNIEKHKDVDIYALELDRIRLHGMLHKQKTNKSPKIINKIGLTGYLFLLLGSTIQQKVGKITGITPGSEMLYAYNKARKEGKDVALIDRDFRITLQKLSGMKAKQKWKMFRELFRPAPKELRFDIRKIPNNKLIEFALEYMKQRLPGIHTILVEERNHVMARNLARIQFERPGKNILAVVGAGHAKELAVLSKKYLNELYEN